MIRGAVEVPAPVDASERGATARTGSPGCAGLDASRRPTIRRNRPAAKQSVSHNHVMKLIMPAVLSAGLLAGPSAGPCLAQTGDTQRMERAYAFNRAGMIDMSEARFDEAIDQFQQAADLVPDYGITKQSLRYTPTFMIGWAHEKQGRIEEACWSFRRFLDLAPADLIEAGKADHARKYLVKHCPATQPPPTPDQSRGL
ncbi:MAG TPA: tetratricopeptide repeat protein [Nitrospiria bacterium]|nr:tetratricopeptide repeat protein [Nitrospiria bacterium]